MCLYRLCGEGWRARRYKTQHLRVHECALQRVYRIFAYSKVLHRLRTGFAQASQTLLEGFANSANFSQALRRLREGLVNFAQASPPLPISGYLLSPAICC